MARADSGHLAGMAGLAGESRGRPRPIVPIRQLYGSDILPGVQRKTPVKRVCTGAVARRDYQARDGGNLLTFNRSAKSDSDARGCFGLSCRLQRLSHGTRRDEFAVTDLQHRSLARFDFVKPLKITGHFFSRLRCSFVVGYHSCQRE